VENLTLKDYVEKIIWSLFRLVLIKKACFFN